MARTGKFAQYKQLNNDTAESATEETGNDKQTNRNAKQTSRVSIYGLFRFASITDKMLLLLGSVFAVIEGAGPAMMAIVFGNMTNVMLAKVQNGFLSADPIAASGAPTTTSTTTIATPTDALNASTATPATAINPALDIKLTAEMFEENLSKFALYYVALGVFIYLASVINVMSWQTACERQAHRIRMLFYCSVLRQEISWFDRNQSGELSSKLNDDVERVRDGLGEQFSSMIKFTSSFFAGFLVGFIMSWRLTSVIVLATPLLAAFSALMGKMLATSTQREQEKYAQAGALAEEVLTSIRTVFALGGQRNEIKNYTRKLEESKSAAMGKYLRLSALVGASMFVLYATYGLALYVASLLLVDNMIDPGKAIAVIMSVMLGSSALGNLIPPLQTVIMATASASLVFDIIDAQPRIDALNERGLKLSKVTANIKFEQVTFTYPTRCTEPVLEQLSFEVNQGQTVAFCGRTGSGKSTVMHLLLRFYDPDEGYVYLDNCNLRDLNVAWLRSLIGVVEQEPQLFDCSIFENIALGAVHESERTYQRVIEAAKLANAHEFVTDLPDGYNTQCGDRGVQMSGGQKQRIAIARALLADPKILLLDEATSALDSESEHIVQQALNRARQGRTTIIIAHRLSTIRDADKICVMREGRIVEQGRHDELMSNKSEYYNLVTNQVFGDELDADNNGAKSTLVYDYDSDSNPAGQLRPSAAAQFTSGRHLDESGAAAAAPAPAPAATTSRLLASQMSAATSEMRLSRSRSMTPKKKISTLSLYESSTRPTVTTLAEYQRDAGASNEHTDDTQQRVIADAPLRNVLRLVKPEMNYLVWSILAAMVSGFLLPTFALLYAQIFDTFSKTGQQLTDASIFWALMFVALGVAMFVSMSLRIVTMAYAIETSMSRLRADCYANILRQHVGWFDMAANSPQRLTTRLASDVPQIKSILNARLSALVAGLSTVAAALLIALYLNWQMALLLALALPILLLVGFWQMRLGRGDRAMQLKRMENASRLATESIEHVKLIQALNQERHFFDKFNQELASPLRDSLKATRRFGLVYGLSQSCIYFVYGAAFRWGAYLMARELLDPITMYRTLFAVAFTAVSAGQWGGIGADASRANQAVAAIMRLLKAQPAIDNLSRGGFMPALKGYVHFQDVHFKYPSRPDCDVLHGLNLSLKPGETLALVGPSGQGKSTIAALLLRFYDPNRGVVRIDDYDVRCINLNHLRMNVGLVSQEPVLFKASIRDNILYGLDKSRYRQRDVISAARVANIDEFVASLPDGYDTQVGDRGCQMSGGQKQRIAIARTIIRNPTILVLDEATSALDAESEALVSAALEKVAKGKTCIKIAHRLSTVRDAHQIAVIQAGRVVEQGTHDELTALGPNGHYFRLMQAQQISA